VTGTATTTGSTLEATARWTAAVRAAETEREDRLFEDPWADALAGDEGRAWLAARTPRSAAPITIRTRFFDDWLAAVPAAGPRQVVLVAAGLDTRSWRLAWPAGIRCFEIDRPAVLEHKATVLAAARAVPRSEVRAVAADLAGAWPESLVAAGFDPAEPATWLLEGLLFYLPGDVIVRVLDGVTALAVRRSRLGFDIVNAETLRSPYTRAWIEMQAAAGAPWIGSLDDPVGFLAARGWSATLSAPGQPEANYGRWTLPVYPVTAPGLPHSRSEEHTSELQSHHDV
jgi:methyltransferase (TIGR00027 family)